MEATNSAMATMNISLPDDMKAMVEARVRSGLYSNVSDYVRDLIRVDLSGGNWVIDDATAAAIDEGEAGGEAPYSLAALLTEARTGSAGD